MKRETSAGKSIENNWLKGEMVKHCPRVAAIGIQVVLENTEALPDLFSANQISEKQNWLTWWQYGLLFSYFDDFLSGKREVMLIHEIYE